jgi:hypothetical protein
MTALAVAATMAAASPAMAAVTVAVDGVPGTPLPFQIFGIKDTGTQVFGSSPNNTNDPNVTYTANSSVDITQGFAQVNDTTPKAPAFNELIINPTEFDYTAMKFAVQLAGAGSFDVYYLLSGSGLDANSFASYTQLGGSFTQADSTNVNYLIDGGTFDGIMIKVTSANTYLFEVKQNSYDGVPAVPEPATWAMMLLGFGGIGMAMRRGRKANARLLQIA